MSWRGYLRSAARRGYGCVELLGGNSRRLLGRKTNNDFSGMLGRYLGISIYRLEAVSLALRKPASQDPRVHVGLKCSAPDVIQYRINFPQFVSPFRGASLETAMSSSVSY